MKFKNIFLSLAVLSLSSGMAAMGPEKLKLSQEDFSWIPPMPTLAEFAANEVNRQIKGMSEEDKEATLKLLPQEMQELVLRTNFTWNKYREFMASQESTLRAIQRQPKHFCLIFLEDVIYEGFAIPSLLKWLLAPNCVQIDEKDRDGYTSLMKAARNGRAEIVRILLDRGVLIDAVNDTGWAALTCAAMRGSEEIVRMFLYAGADCTVRTGYGDTAADIAFQNGHSEIAKLIKNYQQISAVFGCSLPTGTKPTLRERNK